MQGVETPAPAQVTPPAEPPAQPYQIQNNPDGTVTVQVNEWSSTGKMEEVLPKALKAIHDNKEYAKKLQAEAEARTTSVAPPPTPSTTAPPATPVETTEWQADPVQFANALFEKPAEGMIMGLAAAMKTTPQDVAQFLPRLMNAVNLIEQQTQNQEANNVTTQFLAQHPDFPNTEEATKALFQTLAEMGIPEDAKITPKLLSAGHVMAMQQKRYQPMTTQTQTKTAPPPLPPAGGAHFVSPNPGVITGDVNDLRKLSPDQLAKLMRGEGI